MHGLCVRRRRVEFAAVMSTQRARRRRVGWGSRPVHLFHGCAALATSWQAVRNIGPRRLPPRSHEGKDGPLRDITKRASSGGLIAAADHRPDYSVPLSLRGVSAE